jgi:UBX domain-containing protein 1
MGEAAIAEFISITGASRGTALRLLDASGGNLEEAVEKFFAAGGASAAAPAQPAARKPAGGKSGSRSKGINSLATLNQQDEDSDDDDHNEYYVGGEKSGQVVKGGPKDEGRSGDPIEGIFEKARASGARQGRPEDLHPASRGGGSGDFHAFGGRARTLAGGDAAPAESQEAELEEGETVKELTITIAFYANGIFTVNDGEPRRIDDPANLQFMNAISRGQCPPELDPGDPGVHIAVNLVRRGEDYTPPAQPQFTAFGGSGRKLNATAADASGAGAPSTSAAAAGGVASGGVPWEGANPDKPKTSIQLRLADGSRQVAEFNLDHSVGHIRKFIHAARPDMPMTYSLATAFPKAALPDDDVTIESAGLANSVVIQKMN